MESELQIFTIWSDEIKDRIDPSFYKFSSNSFSGVRLEDFINKISSGDYISRDKFTENGVSYLRVQNLKYDGIEIGDLFLKDNEKISKTNKKMFLTGRVGSLGIFRMAKGEYFYSDNILSIEFKEDKKIDLDYLEIILNFPLVTEQIIRNCKGNNQKLISQETIRNLQIPLPPFSAQNKIVSIMQEAYKEKREKEAEAQRLLDSIDDYVLGELGIKIPEIKNNMFFFVYSDEIKDKRMDPKAYLEEPKEIIKAINKSPFKKINLFDLIIESIAGEWGEDVLDEEVKDGCVIANVLRNTNFDNKYNLNMENVAQRAILKNKFEKVKLQEGDILVEKSGGSPIQPVGRVALFENIKGDYYFSNFLQCFRIDKKECLPSYLFAYLKVIYNLGYMEYLQNQTTGIKNLIMEEYLSIPVIVPPLEIQEKIAREADRSQNKAKNLQKESKEVLEKAKREVEKMILGK